MHAARTTTSAPDLRDAHFLVLIRLTISAAPIGVEPGKRRKPTSGPCGTVGCPLAGFGKFDLDEIRAGQQLLSVALGRHTCSWRTAGPRTSLRLG